MAEVCKSTLLAACFGPATLAAVLLAVITASTNPEDGITFLPAAKPLTKNIFSVGSHSHLKARLDNQHRSCQLMDGYLEGLSTERFATGPRSRLRSGSLPAQPSARSYTIDGADVICACGAMILRCLNRQVFK